MDATRALMQELQTGNPVFRQDSEGRYVLGPARTIVKPQQNTLLNNYEIRTLVFFYQHRDFQSFPKYASDSWGAQIPPISYVDSKPLAALFNGKVAIEQSGLLSDEDLQKWKAFETEVRNLDGLSASAREVDDAHPFAKYIHMERALQDRQSLLNNSKRSYESVLKIYENAKSIPQKDKKRTREQRQNHKAEKKRRSKDRPIPIIIVPNAPTSLITIFNVKQFIEKGVFEDSETSRIKRYGGKRPPFVEIKKVSLQDERLKVKFHVFDNVQSLSPSAWSKVVAVFAFGKSWQFKDWPREHIGNSPAEIFSRVKGYHLCYEENELSNQVTQWRVKILRISKQHRGQDASTSFEFWSSLTEFMNTRYGNKFYI